MSTGAGHTYRNDILGNRTYTDFEYPSTVRKFDWDDLGRSTGCRGTSVGATYRYRADGMRVQKVENVLITASYDNNEEVSGYYDAYTSNRPTTRYYYDGQTPVEEDRTFASGSYTQKDVTRYGPGARGTDTVVSTPDWTGQNPVTTQVWPLYDTHGNSAALITKSASTPYYSLGYERQYDPWGTVNGSGTDQGYCANLGHRQDAESGLVYMRARYYEPQTGRFVSQDPAKDGTNWYTYCRNNPLSYVDPRGLFVGLMMSLLVHSQEEDADGATALAAKRWGEEKIKDAVAKHLGVITGYLLGMEIEQSGYTNVGMYFRVTGPDGQLRQVMIDFVDRHGKGGPHIDFQGAKGPGPLFLEGFGIGLRDALGINP